VKNILLIPDAPGWAYDKKADALIKHIPEYNIKKMYYREYVKRAMDFDFNKQFDTILFFWWDNFNGHPPPTALKFNNAAATVTSHRYHLSYPKNYYKAVFSFYKKIGANSPKIFEDIKKMRPDAICCPNGVDYEVYIPKKNKKKKDNKLIVGWVAGKTDLTTDIKGERRVLGPLAKLLESSNVEFKTISTNQYSPKHNVEEMVDYYNSLDVFLCTSAYEGTPNPAFEAASCGVPVIGTDVGCLSQLIEDGKNGYIVGSYRTDDGVKSVFKKVFERLLYLEEDREECNEMGNYNREVVLRDWGWEKRSQPYISFFE